ncbi:MAG: BON domain-containing protein, partial [Pseudomonadota bacterium]
MRSNVSWALLAAAGALTVSCGPTLLVGAGTEVTRTVLQERSTMQALKDTEIQLSLNNSFLSESGELFGDVSTNVTEGRVVLTGSVPRREDKVTATRLAWQTAGVSSVTDELVIQQDSGAVAYVEDAWISNQLRLDLLTARSIRSVNYNIETVDKVVHVTGLARSGAELSRVLDRASRIPGVVKVVSHVL